MGNVKNTWTNNKNTRIHLRVQGYVPVSVSMSPSYIRILTYCFTSMTQLAIIVFFLSSTSLKALRY